MFRHFKDKQGNVHGYEIDSQQDLIAAAIKNKWLEVTDSWPPPVEPFPLTHQQIKAEALAAITVTTQSGKTFDGNETARTDMLVALTVGEWINETQTYWKMANNDTLLVTKDELQEALTLAIQTKGRIVGAIE